MVDLSSSPKRGTINVLPRRSAWALGAAFTLAGLAWQPATAHAQEVAPAPAPAPEAKPKLSFGVTGSINVSHDFKERAFVNLGGPNVKLKVDDFYFGAAFYPSLRLTPDRVAPMLGAGPFVGWKNFQLVVPFYAFTQGSAMKATFGLGYVF